MGGGGVLPVFGRGNFEDITKLAREDVRHFFSHSFDGQFAIDKHKRLIEELRRIDPATFNHKYNLPPEPESRVDFVEELFDWLGKQFERKAPPWVKTEKIIDETNHGETYIIKSEEIVTFLKNMKKWLDRLLGAFGPDDTSPSLDNKWKSGFADYLAKNRLPELPWSEIVFTHAKDVDVLLGFVSRVGISKQKKYIHIIYDREKINEYSDKKSDIGTYYSKVFLHELGHIRRKEDLDWFIDKTYQTESDYVPSNPYHEYGAWLYSITVRMVLSSTRSWLSRFLNDDDPEWKTCC